jgi:GMP synthase (glutamine-hydrolysing)
MRESETEEAADTEDAKLDGPSIPGAESSKKVLLVFHRAESQAGAVGQWLQANGYKLDICCPRLGGQLPETLANHDGAIIFGGPMSANDPDDYIRAEIDWISVPLREKKPFLGICLGAQMLAKQLGADVGLHPDEIIEAGYYPIKPSDAGATLMDWPGHVYQWHREGFSLPGGATRLASGNDFENQAIQYGRNAFGVQFHPEMTLAMIHRWTIFAAHRLVLTGARPRAEHIAAHDNYGAALRAWLDRFMRHWVDSGAGPDAGDAAMSAMSA